VTLGGENNLGHVSVAGGVSSDRDIVIGGLRNSDLVFAQQIAFVSGVRYLGVISTGEADGLLVRTILVPIVVDCLKLWPIAAGFDRYILVLETGTDI
jgi:hypothetical protein